MGYYTDYTISVSDDNLDAYMPAIKKQSGYDYFDNSIKWYNHVEDMIAVSRQFPDVTFRVDGEGEESVDVWTRWYKNGETRSWELEVQIPEGFAPPGGW